MNPTSSRSHSKLLFFNYIKPYMVPFQDIENPKGNLKFTKNSESKKEFFHKTSLSQFSLIGAFFGLDPLILRLLITFLLICERFD